VQFGFGRNRELGIIIGHHTAKRDALRTRRSSSSTVPATTEPWSWARSTFLNAERRETRVERRAGQAGGATRGTQSCEKRAFATGELRRPGWCLPRTRGSTGFARLSLVGLPPARRWLMAELARRWPTAHGRFVGRIRLSRNPMPAKAGRDPLQRPLVSAIGWRSYADAGVLALLASARVSAMHCLAASW
jgi:hypothetical protein